MSTYNIGFYEDLTKISFIYHQISSNTQLFYSSDISGRAGGDNSPLASSTSSSSHKTIGMHKSHSAGLNIKSPSSGGGAAMRSPCTGVGLQSPNGGLRIGLSRNMKLKPLHPNLKIQN